MPELVEETSIIHIGWPKNDRYEELEFPKGKLVTCIGAVSARKGTRTLILNKSDLVVIPSNYESFGIVAVEAMQRGCQIIASRVGGLPEVLGESGHFFTPGMSAELAQKMKGVLLGSLHIPKESVLERSDVFDFERMLGEFEEIFK